MSRYRLAVTNLVHHLRPTPLDFAAAAAPHDPSLLLGLQATRPGRDRPPCPAR